MAEDIYADEDAQPRRKGLWIVLTVIVALVVGGVAYWFVIRSDGAKPAQETAKPKTQTQKQLITEKTEHHLSNYFMLEFDYPKDWTVQETTGSGVLTVRSPVLELTDASAGATRGRVVLTIRDKQQPLAEFDKGNALAVIESEKIAYSEPSSVQRGSTYISFLQYASTTERGINGIYITGDFGYQKGQAIPKADFAPVDPVISIAFIGCDDDACAGAQKPLTLSVDSWQVSTLLATPLKNLLKSFIIN